MTGPGGGGGGGTAAPNLAALMQALQSAPAGGFKSSWQVGGPGAPGAGAGPAGSMAVSTAGTGPAPGPGPSRITAGVDGVSAQQLELALQGVAAAGTWSTAPAGVSRTPSNGSMAGMLLRGRACTLGVLKGDILTTKNSPCECMHVELVAPL